MQAGRLEIEIVAEIARLQADMRKVEREVGKMADGVNTKTKAVNDNIAGMGRAFGSANAASAKTAFGMRNLGFQLQDLGVQFAGAAQSSDPFRGVMMALIQQGPQIKDAMGQAEIGVGGLLKTLATGAARFGVFAVAAGAGFYHLKQFTDGLNDSAGTDQFIRSLGLTADEVKNLEGATISYGDIALGTWDVIAAGIWDTIGPAVMGAKTWFDEWFAQTNANGAKLINDLVGFFVGGYNAIGAVWSKLPAAIGDVAISTANSVIAAINKMIQTAVNGVNGLINSANTILSKVGMEVGTLQAPQIGAIKNSYAGAGAGAGKAFTGAFEAAQTDYVAKFTKSVSNAANKRFQDRMRAQAADLIGDRSGGKSKPGGSSRAKGLDEEAKALQRATDAANRYLEALEGETARIGKNAIEIKKMEVAANAAATSKAGLADLAKKITDAGAAWEKATRAQADADFQTNVIKPLQDELALLGLVGPARELAALALEEQAFKAKAAKDGITDVNRAWQEYLGLRTKIINGESAMERERQEAELLNDQLRDMIGLLGGLGKVGQAVGGLLGIFTGNTSAVGGPIGDLLNAQVGQRWDDKEQRNVAVTIGDEISKVFKTDGAFGKTMTSILQGAGTGSLAATAIFGKQSLTGQIGSAVGGALGKELGTMLGSKVGGMLGQMGGPLGSILGGIAGGMLGNLVKKDPSAWSNLGTDSSGKVVTNYSTSAGGGDTAGRDSLANAAMDVLDQIANAFGGSLAGGVQLGSIGTRKGQAVTDWTPGTKEGRNYYSSPEEAVKAFVAHALEVGVLGGVKAGTLTLLKRTGDLEKNLADALSFENVFKELQGLKDPLGSAFAELNKQATELRRIFADASATVAEYAQLEEYLSIKRQEVIDAEMQKAAQDFQERADLEVELLRLLGREQEALNLAREAELSGMKASLKPLQQMIYTLQDARAIIDQFGPLADDLRAYKAELLGGSATGSFGFLKQQFQSVSTMAANGDADAMAKLQAVSDAYLEAARDNASSKLEYDRAVGEALGSLDRAIFAADTKVDYAKAQIDAVNYNSEILDQMRSEMTTLQQRLVEQGDVMERLVRRIDGDGVLIREGSAPVSVVTV